MTQELPPLINAEYDTNGKNAVGGLSSTGGTASITPSRRRGSIRPSAPTAAFLPRPQIPRACR